MSKRVKLTKSIRHIDTLVIGGGAAGIAAAVSAARVGKSVALVERAPFLGGKATAAYVGTICGLYLRSETLDGQYVSNGFAKEFAEKLQMEGNATHFKYKKGLQFLSYAQPDFLKTCDDWVLDPLIEVYLQSSVHSVKVEGQKVTRAEALVYDQNVHFFPKEVIDCSGEAVVANLCGLETIQSDEYQAGAQVFTMSGLSEVPYSILNLALLKLMKKAIEGGRLSPTLNRMSIVPGSAKDGQVVLKIGLPQIIDNQLNKVTSLQLNARALVQEVAQFLTENSLYFKHARISFIAPEVGIRTGKRHIGAYILTREDVLNCRKFEDGVAKGAWPIEDWRVGENPTMEYFEPGNYYDIPARCLVSNQLSNLLFAGRNISADDGAIGSARVIGTCLQTGFAAGQIRQY